MNPDRRSIDFAQNWLPAIGNSLKAGVFALTLCATLFALCTSAEAQQPTKTRPHRRDGNW